MQGGRHFFIAELISGTNLLQQASILMMPAATRGRQLHGGDLEGGVRGIMKEGLCSTVFVPVDSTSPALICRSSQQHGQGGLYKKGNVVCVCVCVCWVGGGGCPPAGREMSHAWAEAQSSPYAVCACKKLKCRRTQRGGRCDLLRSLTALACIWALDVPACHCCPQQPCQTWQRLLMNVQPNRGIVPCTGNPQGHRHLPDL